MHEYRTHSGQGDHIIPRHTGVGRYLMTLAGGLGDSGLRWNDGLFMHEYRTHSGQGDQIIPRHGGGKSRVRNDRYSLCVSPVLVRGFFPLRLSYLPVFLKK